jgi:small redox-active disulfide protein 2
MKIQVLGTGCPKCLKLTENAKTAVSELGVDAEIEKVESIDEIIKMGVMMTPGLVVDGEVVSTGKALTVKDIKDLLS